MNILVVGSGGREHAVIKALAGNKIYAAPGNGGISKQATCVPLNATDIDGIVAFCKTNAIDLCVVAPDDPLVLGMVDALTAAGIKAFGPNKAAAILEGSKVFSKKLMRDYNIPTADYAVFDDAKSAIDYITQKNEFPTVIKADGLALGKGVIIAQTLDEAVDGVRSIMQDRIFGASGNSIVIEEFITGPEVSVLAFCDGKTIVPMISAMDHKRAFDNNCGPNTGGMGTIAPNPFYDSELQSICMETIFVPTMLAMNKENRPFKGVIFFGLMITPKGVKVIEYNCRFGDPETQVVLPLLQTSLADIFLAVCDERLSDIDITFSDKACACVVMASGGYPKKYETGIKIAGLNSDGGCSSATVYHSGTKLVDGDFVTAGGRVLGVCSMGDSLPEAIENAYAAVATISFDNAHYRTDIGKSM